MGRERVGCVPGTKPVRGSEVPLACTRGEALSLGMGPSHRVLPSGHFGWSCPSQESWTDSWPKSWPSQKLSWEFGFWIRSRGDPGAKGHWGVHEWGVVRGPLLNFLNPLGPPHPIKSSFGI